MDFVSIRKRLRLLSRTALKSGSPAELQEPRPGHDASLPSTGYNPVRLEKVIRGQEVATTAGKFLLIDRSASEIVSSAGEFVSRYSYCFRRGAAAISQESGPIDLVKFVKCGPRKSVFLDIETTGLCGSPLFLAGLLFYRERGLLVRQLFARDYSEERPLLEHLLELLDEFEIVVTFNGKSFDIPYIKDRCSYNMLPFRVELHHLDLLHEYRRRWKGVLPDCRLQTLESRICYRYREGDIPGNEIPEAYHDFVRTGDAWQIKDILHHNAFDLITMSELTLRLFTSDT